MSPAIDQRRGGAGTLPMIVAAAISAVLSLAYIIYAGRQLGPAEYADFAAGLSIIYVFAVAFSPITPTLARVIARLQVRGDSAAIAALRRSAVSRVGALSVAGGLVSAALAPFAARILNFRSSATVAMAAITALLFVVLSVDRGVLQGLMRFREYNINSIIETFIRCFGAVLLLAVFNKSATVALTSYAVAILVVESIIAFTFFRDWRHVDRAPANWSEVTRLARPMFLLMLAIAVIQNADMLAMKRWFTAYDSGLYGAATALSRGFGVLFVPLYVMGGPMLTEMHERGERITGPALRLCAWFLALSIPPLIVVLLWAEPIVGALYGSQFAGAAPLIAALGGVSIITYVALMLTQLLITIHDFRFLAIYGAVVLIQVTGLSLFHQSAWEVISVLYVSQSLSLLLISVMVGAAVRGRSL